MTTPAVNPSAVRLLDLRLDAAQRAYRDELRSFFAAEMRDAVAHADPSDLTGCTPDFEHEMQRRIGEREQQRLRIDPARRGHDAGRIAVGHVHGDLLPDGPPHIEVHRVGGRDEIDIQRRLRGDDAHRAGRRMDPAAIGEAPSVGRGTEQHEQQVPGGEAAAERRLGLRRDKQ